MDWIQIMMLALIQGISEFLPISSSAHLILPSELLGWPDQGLAFDVAVHIGSLGAVVTYFKQDLQRITLAWWSQITHQTKTPEAKLAWMIVIATLPAVGAGFMLADLIDVYFRNIGVIAATTIGFGLLLGWADHQPAQAQDELKLTWQQALLIGFAQALALIPGTSRSGITITAALFLGLTRTSAARFSFLLSIPLILGAASLMSIKLYQSNQTLDWHGMLLGSCISFGSAWLCIHFFLKIINKMSMLPFVLYRLALGAFLCLFLIF
ncbi:MAG: undecaprenyl-diphosphate phosphatase [Shewanellaceae bacterium]|nr:undecaprenyl-diphosphate phosphatase [Shewanellaceae bacterium]